MQVISKATRHTRSELRRDLSYVVRIKLMVDRAVGSLSKMLGCRNALICGGEHLESASKLFLQR